MLRLTINLTDEDKKYLAALAAEMTLAENRVVSANEAVKEALRRACKIEKITE